jgi:hypothetical protein
VPAGTTTLVSQAFEGNVTYRIVPTVTVDTPDGFGKSTRSRSARPTTSIMFSSDGTLIDQAGNPLNGTVFLAVVNVAKSQRAVTVLGATGRVRGYKWACNWNNSVCGWNRV